MVRNVHGLNGLNGLKGLKGLNLAINSLTKCLSGLSDARKSASDACGPNLRIPSSVLRRAKNGKDTAKF